jgi:hypothetical protein
MLTCRIPSEWFADFSLCLFEWQTLVGGLLALAAALLGAGFLYKQIKQTADLHREELRRRHNAVRSTMPLALAAINDLVAHVVDNLASTLESEDQPDFEVAFEDAAKPERSDKFVRISTPPYVMETMRSFVETLSLDREIRHIAELISSIQILIARYNSFSFKEASVIDRLYGLLIDAAKVSLLNDTLYNYGRFVDNGSFGLVGTLSDNEAWDKIHGRAQGTVFQRRSPDFFFARIKERIDQSKTAGTSPWIEKFDL